MSDETNPPQITPASPPVRQTERRLLYLLTRTPLHVGAGASVGAIDLPVIRERHTGFPIIPATSLKGTFADAWLTKDMPRNAKGERVRVKVKAKNDGDKTVLETSDAAWLFGSDEASHAWAGALQFSEARLLAFPIRSAKGSFAWITCPLMLQRAVRDGVLLKSSLPASEPGSEQALFDRTCKKAGKDEPSPLVVDAITNGKEAKQVVLEEYTFTYAGDLPKDLARSLENLIRDDEVWGQTASRLVVVSNGMMSFFAENSCEVAQHVKISDETGTAAGGALFNQENVPSETLFYAVLHASDERTADKAEDQRRKAEDAINAFATKVAGRKVFQFGGDASTGLGYCTVAFNEKGA